MKQMPNSGIIEYCGKVPSIGAKCFLASGAYLIGELTVGDDCSFWFNTVVRADCNTISIGHRTNVQDGTVVHVTNKTGPTVIGNDVTIGHNATIHACTIGDFCLIGMNATILDGAVIGKNTLVAAGSVVTPNKKFPEGVLLKGAPATVARKLSEKEIEDLKISRDHYLIYKEGYL